MPSRRSKLFPTPQDAETAFYEAFERGDIAAMMAVWAEADDVVCLSVPRRFGSVGSFYRSFLQVTDAEVAALLREAQASRPPA